jgi:2-polyprenyl-3-methyl-5-hydroxy-6-metoxy-1,4-benzoquinol methylase
MTGKETRSRPDAYWDRAGEQGYAKAMYCNCDVELHIRGRLWRIAVEIADALGVPSEGCVLDVGCGDGAFANQVLARRYRTVEGLDKSETAIRRAQVEAQGNASYRSIDLTKFDYDLLSHYDAAFLIGILHHIKPATPYVVRALARRTNKLIVLEPNGSNFVRKLLELTPSYRDAGEDSFRKAELAAIFEAAGWRTAIWRRLNLFPNFTPRFAYRLLAPMESWIEPRPFWNRLCTVNMYGLTAGARQ